MSILELAERTGLAVNTIKRAEETNEAAAVNVANANLLVRTLEEAGVTFIPASADLGAGARLTNSNQPPLARRRLPRMENAEEKTEPRTRDRSR